MSRAGLLEAIGSTAVSAPAGGGVDQHVRRSVVTLFETAAGLVYRVGDAEVERRSLSRLGALTRLNVLDALMNLPAGVVVPWDGLTSAERRVVAGLPAGVVDSSEAGVKRLAVAPVVPDLAVVALRDWRRGLVTAGQFAPYCARSVLLPRAPSGSELGEARARAALYGVGLYVMSRDGLQVLAEPEPFVRRRHTAAQWLFAEQLWRQVSHQASDRAGDVGGDIRGDVAGDQVRDNVWLSAARLSRPADQPTR